MDNRYQEEQIIAIHGRTDKDQLSLRHWSRMAVMNRRLKWLGKETAVVHKKVTEKRGYRRNTKNSRKTL
jgi:hypothetical protein